MDRRYKIGISIKLLYWHFFLAANYNCPPKTEKSVKYEEPDKSEPMLFIPSLSRIAQMWHQTVLLACKTVSMPYILAGYLAGYTHRDASIGCLTSCRELL